MTSPISPMRLIERYVFGIHAKTKRSLAEEVESGDDEATKTWIRDGVNPNEVDAYGYTPLLNACAVGRLSAVNELIKVFLNRFFLFLNIFSKIIFKLLLNLYILKFFYLEWS
jgi:hypothetical protein